MSESGRICLPAYDPVPSNYAWRLQSIGAIALSIEVPFVFGRQNPRGLCVHEVLFQGAITPSVANITASVSMSAITSDCVAKPFAALRASNNRIQLNGTLNQCCALVCILESILLILVVKILLQHNHLKSGHSLAQPACPLCANSDRQRNVTS